MAITIPAGIVAGTITIGSGGPYELVFPAGASHVISGGTFSLESSVTISVQSQATAEIDSTIIDTTNSIPGELVSKGTGTLILGNPDNSYSGGTQIAFGSTVQLTNNANLGQPTNPLQLIGTLDVNGCGLTVGSLTGGGTVENSSGLVTFTVATDSALDTFSGKITGAIDLQTAGSGVLALAGTDSYTGSTYIVSGTLQLDSDAALPSLNDYTDLTISSSGVLDLNGYSTIVASLNGPAGSLITDTSDSNSTQLSIVRDNSSDNPVFYGSIDNGMNSVISVYLADGAQTLAGQNTCSGGVTLSDGRLWLGNGTAAGNGMIGGEIMSTDQDEVFFNVASGTTETFAGYFVGNGGQCSLTKTGAGTLVLSPSQQDQYFRGTLVEEGKLVLGNENALPGVNGGAYGVSSSVVTVDGDSTLDLDNLPGTLPLTDVCLIDGTITDGTLTLAANGLVQVEYGEIDADVTTTGSAELQKVQYSGTANISGIPSDTVVVSATSNLESLTSVDVAEGTLTVDGVLGVPGSVVTVGSNSGSLVGVLTLDPASLNGNTFSGGVQIASGTLNIAGDNALGETTADPNITFTGSGVLQWGSQFDLSAQRTIQIDTDCTATIDTNGNVVDIPDNIVGGGNLAVSNSFGSLTLSGINTYLGDTTIGIAAVYLDQGLALPANTNLTINGGTLGLDGLTTSVLNTVTLNNGAIGDGDGGTLQASGNFNLYNGQVSANLAGAARLTMEGSANDRVTLSGENSYTGHTRVYSGTLSLGDGTNSGNPEALPIGTVLIVNGGTLDLSNQNITVDLLSGTGGVISDYGYQTITSTITVYQDTATACYGDIEDMGASGVPQVAVDMTGSGTLVLAGDNTYSAGAPAPTGTTVSSGTLVIVNASAQPDTNLTVLAGATLIYDPSYTPPPQLANSLPTAPMAGGGLGDASGTPGDASETPAPLFERRPGGHGRPVRVPRIGRSSGPGPKSGRRQHRIVLAFLQ